MGIFRVVLLLANTAFLVHGMSMSLDYINDGQSWSSSIGVFNIVAAAFLMANLIYLLIAPWRGQSRVFSLVGLWFDAKEAELRARAQKAQENSN